MRVVKECPLVVVSVDTPFMRKRVTLISYRLHVVSYIHYLFVSNAKQPGRFGLERNGDRPPNLRREQSFPAAADAAGVHVLMHMGASYSDFSVLRKAAESKRSLAWVLFVQSPEPFRYLFVLAKEAPRITT